MIHRYRGIRFAVYEMDYLARARARYDYGHIDPGGETGNGFIASLR